MGSGQPSDPQRDGGSGGQRAGVKKRRRATLGQAVLRHPFIEALEPRLVLAEIAFGGAAEYATRVQPKMIATADFTGDGRPDIAVSDNLSGRVGIFRSIGDGAFAPRIDYTLPTPKAIYAAEFNGDGKPDLALAWLSGNKLSVAFNQGNGSFGPRTDYDIGLAAPVVADFNGDGLADVATTSTAGVITVLRNNGSGALGERIDYSGGVASAGLMLGDFDGDDAIDLGLVSGTSIGVLFNAPDDPDVDFGPRTISTVRAFTNIGDINGDNLDDLIGNAHVQLGNGNGTFGTIIEFAGVPMPSPMVAADFSGDGKADLAIANFDGSSLSVLLSSGLNAFAPRVDWATGSGPAALVAADFNFDGRNDVATVNFYSDSVSVLLNQGDGTFNAIEEIQTTGIPGKVVTGDFNEDGLDDLMLGGAGGSVNRVMLSIGGGKFVPGVTFTSRLDVYDAADFDRDGNLDVLSMGTIFYGNGNGGFIRRTVPNVGGGVAADFNGDGWTDVAFSGGGSFSYARNKGDGTFATPATYFPPGGGAGPALMPIVAADLSGDGIPDVAHISSLEDRLRVWINNGNGVFTGPATYTTAGNPQGVTAGDFNSDGKVDLAVATWTNLGVSVFINQGASFANGISASSDYEASLVVASDFNSDGVLDLVASGEGHTLGVLRGNGNGTFAVPARRGLGSWPTWLAMGDFNGDGLPDAVSANGVQSVSVRLSAGNADADDQIGEAIPLGAMDKTRFQSRPETPLTPHIRSLETASDVDMYSVTVSENQRIGFDVDLPTGSPLNPYIRLFNSSGTQLASNNNAPGPGELSVNLESYLEYTFSTSGTYYLAVSANGNVTFDPMSGAGDVNAPTAGEYFLIASPGLAGTIRADVGLGPQTFVVDILRRGAAPPPINALSPQEAWLVVHGRVSSRETVEPLSIPDLLGAIEAERLRLGHQVQMLSLDWSGPANSIEHENDLRQEDWTKPVAEWAALALTQSGFSGSALNLVGHSWGANVADETAERILGGVNTIVAIDPAADGPPVFGGGFYSPNLDVNFAAHSAFSWSFFSLDTHHLPLIYGNSLTAATADEAIVVTDSEHSALVNLFTWMVQHPTMPYASHFRLDRLLNHVRGPWETDRYSSLALKLPRFVPAAVFEARLSATTTGEEPDDIDYVQSPTEAALNADAGSVEIDSRHAFTVVSIGPSARVTVATGGNNTLRTTSLIIAPGGVLNQGDNALVVDYQPPNPMASASSESSEGISALIASGRNGGTWDGSGIVSSVAAANPNGFTGLGVAESSRVLQINGAQTAEWNGEVVDATTLLVAYTFVGDADLNGRIDADDYFWIDRGYAIRETGYANGDFDYNGRVDVDDYFLIDVNFQRSQAAALPQTTAGRYSATLEAEWPGRLIAVAEHKSVYERLIEADAVA